MTILLTTLAILFLICAIALAFAYYEALKKLAQCHEFLETESKQSDHYFMTIFRVERLLADYAEPANWKRNEKSHRAPIYKVGPDQAQEALKMMHDVMWSEP